MGAPPSDIYKPHDACADTPPSPGARRWASPIQSAVATWGRHSDLLRNVLSLAATTGVTAGFGFLYWAVAARLFTPRAVGYASAAVSAMSLLGTIGVMGLGTLLIGELPRRRSRSGLVSAALLSSSLVSLTIGIVFVVIIPLASKSFADVSGTFGRAALFASGVALTATSVVFDQATIGLLRGGLQLSRNIVFSIAKILALPAVALVLHDGLGVGIIASWVAGMAVSFIPVAIRILWGRAPIFLRPNWGLLRTLGKTTLAHNWLNLTLAARQTALPILVTVVVSPSANAAFYAAWMLAGFLSLVPSHSTTVLFAVARADAQALSQKIRFTLRLSFSIGLPGMLALGLVAHLLLGLFGAHYAAEATVPLWLLTFAYLPSVPLVHYVAISRISGRMARAAGFMTAAVAIEAIAATIGGRADGLIGLTVALVGVRFAEGILSTPTVITTALARGRHRRAHAVTASSEVSDEVEELPLSSPVTDPRWQERQQAGLSALLALSSMDPTPTIPVLLNLSTREHSRPGVTK